MLTAVPDPERRPFWKEIALVVALAVATAIVYQLGETARELLRARRERMERDSKPDDSKGGDTIHD